MTDPEAPLTTGPAPAPLDGGTPAKPCIALMGEFSAGKSTLSNLLIGQSPLPVRVTATQLPPVRLSYGTGPAWREDHAGNRVPVEIDRLAEISPADTKLIQIHVEADLLELCDLIDMPGISDPNMAAEVWRNVIGLADGVIWCSHATQAWRQSEAAVWEELADTLSGSSLLLLTRFDKLVSAEDRARVLRRVERETEGLFAAVYPVALLQAIAGRNDWEAWTESGAEAFSQGFVSLLNRLRGRDGRIGDRPALQPFAPRPQSAAEPGSAPDGQTVRPRRVRIEASRTRKARPGGIGGPVGGRL